MCFSLPYIGWGNHIDQGSFSKKNFFSKKCHNPNMCDFLSFILDEKNTYFRVFFNNLGIFGTFELMIFIIWKLHIYRLIFKNDPNVCYFLRKCYKRKAHYCYEIAISCKISAFHTLQISPVLNMYYTVYMYSMLKLSHLLPI